jgi:hypothetical protein
MEQEQTDTEIGFTTGVIVARHSYKQPTEEEITLDSYKYWLLASKGILLSYRLFYRGYRNGVHMYFNGFIGEENNLGTNTTTN